MKKLIALGILSLGIVFLASCSQEQATQPQEIVYTNSEYGFTLIFPETWSDYTVKNETFDGPTLGSYYVVAFGFTAQDALFHISMYSKSQWTELQSEEGPTPTYLDENDQYVFAYSTAQDAANETMVARMSEVQEIIKTFVVTTVENPAVVTTTATQKSLEEYFATRDQFINSEMTKDPDTLGLKELANVAVTCPDSLGTPCAGNLLVLSKDSIQSDEQEFYLAFTMGTGYVYYGPFTDDLQKIVDESETIESLERSY